MLRSRWGSYEGFKGFERDSVECDCLLHSRWTPALLRRENALFATKWWDYRHLHPVQATDFFGHVFTVELRAIIRAHIDDRPPSVTSTGKVRDWSPLGTGDIFDPPFKPSSIPTWKKKLSGLIKARQLADEDGIPYPFFVRTGLRFLYFGGGVHARQHVTLPMPSLLGADACLARIREDWIDIASSRVTTAEHPRFRWPGDGSEDFKRHSISILRQAKSRPVPALAIARLQREGFLPHPQAPAKSSLEKTVSTS